MEGADNIPMEAIAPQEKSETDMSQDQDQVEEASVVSQVEPLLPVHPVDSNKPAPFDYITENAYLTDRAKAKKVKRMVCDCQFDPEEDDPSEACGENCLNRVLMIECGSRCPCGEYCNNKRFQRCQYANVEVFKTTNKGWGLQATENIPAFSFVMEYCGEVCTPEEFELRKIDYSKEKRRHYYFMSLKTDEILDATRKGNYSRFINHSCDPNCETQKWTVGGKLRVGFFTVRAVEKNEELTFDYKFQRFGEAAQQCYCGSANCRGYLGAPKQSENRLLGVEGCFSSPNGRESKRRGRGRGDADSMFEKQVYDIVGSSWRLKEVSQVLAFSRLMLQAESLTQRGMLLRVLQSTEDPNSMKRFLSLHGLRLLWSWMVELTDIGSKQVLDTRVEVLNTLSHLPIPNKNLLNDNKILPVVQKWAEPRKTTPQQQSDSEQQSPAVTVREADCTEGGTESNGGSSVKQEEDEDDDDMEEEGVLCEAEARESSSDNTVLEEEETMITVASELLEKWSKLKEVFRIPKKTPQQQPASLPVSQPEAIPCDKLSSNDAEKVGIDRQSPGNQKVKKKRPSRWDPVVEKESIDKLPVPLRDTKKSPSNFTHSHYGRKQRTSLLGNPTLTPVQNTVIVQQQPGQSVYVQQQLFPSPQSVIPVAQPSLIQTQQLPGVSVSNPSLVVQQNIHPSLQPIPQVGSVPPQTIVHYPAVVQTTQSGTSIFSSLSASVQSLPATLPPFPIPFPTQAGSSLSSQFPQPPANIATTGTITNYQLAPPPPPAEEDEGLPPEWKSAKDQAGKVYYYHIPTRKTQWDRPVIEKSKDSEGETMMELSTPEHQCIEDDQELNEHECQPHTPEGSPPSSPSVLSDRSTSPVAVVPAVEEDEDPLVNLSRSSKKPQSVKDQFRHSLSQVVVRCLDHHRKADCKYGRITCSEDFRYLARKLTYGLTEKEKTRRGGDCNLVFNASVKSRAKDYIQKYMKKFGVVYKRT